MAVEASEISPAQAQVKVVLLSKDFDRIKVVQLAAKRFGQKKMPHIIDARIHAQGSQFGLYRNYRTFDVTGGIPAC